MSQTPKHDVENIGSSSLADNSSSSTHKIVAKIRVEASTVQEIDVIVDALSLSVEVVEVFRYYPNKGKSGVYRELIIRTK